MVLKKIPEGKYSIISSAKGPVGKVVVEAWQQIWIMEEGSELERAYKADYEIYDERSHDPQSAQVDIFVGIE